LISASFAASAGDEVTLTVSGSDSLDEPVRFILGGTSPTASRQAGTVDRPAGTHLRVASLNTWRHGMVDRIRGPSLIRLLNAVSPDVILLQEEYDTAPDALRQVLASAFPGDWDLVKVAGNVIATRMPLTQFPTLDPSHAAAITTHHTLGPILLLAVHKRCCGHIGSREDVHRIEQTRALMRTIDLVRAHHDIDIPVVLAGDWNLVGSRTPLDLLTQPTGPDLHAVDARHLSSLDTYTWFNPRSDFTPGRLDLAAVDARSSASRAFLVDSRALDPAQLRGAGLQAADSSASDHLLLVLDLIR
jgi:endonuclease/exonuclease/phosphatase family metal-dependent hydrolase